MAGRLTRGSAISNAKKLFGGRGAVFTPSRETLWALKDWVSAWGHSAAILAHRALTGSGRCSHPARAAAQGPVAVLLPGVWERWEVLSKWGRALAANGFDVRFVPELDLQLGSLESLGQALSAFLEAGGLEDVLVVAHSKGGLVAKKTMIGPQGWRIRRLISCGTPHQGAPLAALSPKALKMRDLRPQEKQIRKLASSTDVNTRIVAIQAKWDQNVPWMDSLPGGKVVTANVRGHHRILRAPETLALVVRYALD